MLLTSMTEDNCIFVDVYLDNVSLSVIGIDALGIECFSNGVTFSDTGKCMRVFFDDVCWAREFSFIIELSGKTTKVSRKRKK